jgi:hypothetical protein
MPRSDFRSPTYDNLAARYNSAPNIPAIAGFGDVASDVYPDPTAQEAVVSSAESRGLMAGQPISMDLWEQIRLMALVKVYGAEREYTAEQVTSIDDAMRGLGYTVEGMGPLVKIALIGIAAFVLLRG